MIIGLYHLLLDLLKSLGPTYSATKAREDAADTVSQSLSMCLLGLWFKVDEAASDSVRWEGAPPSECSGALSSLRRPRECTSSTGPGSSDQGEEHLAPESLHDYS